MHYPIKFENVLPYWLFRSLQDEYYFNGWIFNNVSNVPEEYSGSQRKSWSMNHQPNNQLIFYEIATHVKYKIKKKIQKDISFIRAHTNGYVYGQTGGFHKDFVIDNVWTFVLFTSPNWDTQWGGEFVCYDRENDEYHYVPYIPNSGALIPSNWENYGSAPNELANSLRTTLALSFAEKKMLESVKEIKIVKRFI